MGIDTDRIHKPVRKLRKFLKKSPKTPASHEIHDLRTNARRMETAVSALGHVTHKNERRLLRDLVKLKKSAGKVRNMDVLTSLILTVNIDGEQDCVVRLIETLGAKRTKQVKKLRAFIARKGTRLRGRLKRSGSKLENFLGKGRKTQPESTPDAPVEVMAKAIRLAEKLKDPTRLAKTNLHEYRLRVKELRDILQLADNADQQHIVKVLGEAKDAIGEWHDWVELIAIASEVLDHGTECKLLPKLRGISETKYLRALSLTNQMKHALIVSKASRKKGSGAGKPQVIRPAVLTATSAIPA
jgi:CHAD domain-containing protein